MNSMRETKEQKRRKHDKWAYGLMAFLTSVLIVLTTSVFASEVGEVKNGEKEVYILNNDEVEFSDTKTLNVQENTSKSTMEKVDSVNSDLHGETIDNDDETLEDSSEFRYKKEIPMPLAHQEYLFELTEKYGLDYLKTLAVIQHESVFDPNATNETNDFGYFQVNQINHAQLSDELDTPNAPLDPYVNMEWGTYMLKQLYERWGSEGYSGEILDHAVWSSYNRGNAGFMKNGFAVEYIEKMKNSILEIERLM